MFFVKHIGSKRVWMSPATLHPTTEWVAQQARNFTMFLRDHDLQATHIICDRDTKYRGLFCDVLRGDGIEVERIVFAAPEMNCHAESFVGTLKRERLNHFVISSIDHMRHLCQQYALFYNTVRTHRALDNRTIGQTQVPTAPDDYAPEKLVCEKWLGGVLKHYQ